MNAIKLSSWLIIAFLLISSIHGMAQGRHRGGGGHPHAVKQKVMVVKPAHRPRGAVVVRSKYRPAKIVVYHPYWGPKYSFYRRWVYFPRYNFYWDNWRQCYFFWNGVVWIHQTTPPPVVVNVNLEKEKHYELKDLEDDVDDVYKTNNEHKAQFKTDSLK